jgi:deoxyxylulose-5-phosphate synthase
MAVLNDSTESLSTAVGDMLQHLKWRSLEDRRRDARHVMMYKISHDKVAVSKSDRLSHNKRISLKICTTQGVNFKDEMW